MSEKIKQRKAYKFRMEPTARQADEPLCIAGAARFVWNWGLDRCQTFYKANQKSISPSQLSGELTSLKKQQRWLYDFDSQALQQVLADLKRAYENHFNRNMRAGFPKFKTKKSRKQSFRIPQRVVLKNAKVYVPKLGWIRVRQSQEMEGGSKSATFKRTSTQLCSECGYKDSKLSLSDREWECPACETRHLRDLNAALNLKAVGLKQLVASGYVEP
jgi:transposase